MLLALEVAALESLSESPPVRPAGGHFLLLAQQKVTKEEGLEHRLL